MNGTTILSGATYDPFGPATGWTWGNATTMSRTFDQDGNPAHIVTAAVTTTYSIDNASRITGISDSGSSSKSFTFGYDQLDRVTSGTSTAITRGYTYDANSNRLTTTGTNASVETIAAANNRLNSTTGSIARTYSYDAAGNTQGYASNSYTFNKRGRMSQATVVGSATNYLYNALGQLIEKYGNGGTTLLMYDEAGHLLGEYSSAGALVQETIWMGDTPVATLRPSGSTVAIYYVHTDHLGTPRKITRPSDNALMWRWDPDTFGSVAPSGSLTYNLRFPGQYSLNESSLYYNYFRDYDPQTGRYIESDPIGLAGGINTYAYANGNPVSNSDPLGLWSTAAHNALIAAIARQWNLTPLQIQAMEAGSYHADSFQDADHAYMHAMSSSTLTKAQACQKMNAFVKDSVNRANDLAHSGDMYGAFYNLGFGLHATMDSTSPVHAGFQEWHTRDFLNHGAWPESKEDVNSLTQDLIDQTLALMNAAANGATTNCSCSEN